MVEEVKKEMKKEVKKVVEEEEEEELPFVLQEVDAVSEKV